MSRFYRLAALWCLSAILCGQVAQAKVLVVTSNDNVGTAATIERAKSAQARVDNVVRMLLDRFGSDYKFVSARQVRTEFARTGKMVWNYGTSAAYAEQFDAVIHTGFRGSRLYVEAGYRPDSLTLSATVAGTEASHGRSMPSVPNLFLMSQYVSTSVAYNQCFDDTTTDSLGIATGYGVIPVGAGFGSQYLAPVYQVGNANAWYPSGFQCGWAGFNSTRPAGGLRPILRPRASTSDGIKFSENAPTGYPSAWVDPDNALATWWNTTAANYDSLAIWDLMMAHVTGAKPIVMTYPFGTSGCTDSLATGGSAGVPCEFSLDVMTAGLAHLDSLSGGLVLGKKPVKMTVLIDGGFSRSGSRNPGGIDPADTTDLKSSIVLAGALGIPAVLTADPDSANTYLSEFSWWKNWPALKFTPVTRLAALDTTLLGVSLSASSSRYVDIFGLNRNRTALGDGTASGRDSSVSSMWASSASALDRRLAAQGMSGRVSKCVVAPLDDWTPRNFSGNYLGFTGGPTPDSLLYALSLRGAACLIQNGQRPWVANGNQRGDNFGAEGGSIGRLSSGFRVLNHSGYRTAGSRLVWDIRDDSTTIFSQSVLLQYVYPHLVGYECSRAWGQLLLPTYRDYDIMPYDRIDPWDEVNTPSDDRRYGLVRGSVFRMSVQDFGGGFATPALRPGYWTLKSMKNGFDAMNRLAGRTIITFAYPEDIEP